MQCRNSAINFRHVLDKILFRQHDRKTSRNAGDIVESMKILFTRLITSLTNEYQTEQGHLREYY